MPAHNPSSKHQAKANEIAADVAAYLKKGGKVTVLDYSPDAYASENIVNSEDARKKATAREKAKKTAGWRKTNSTINETKPLTQTELCNRANAQRTKNAKARQRYREKKAAEKAALAELAKKKIGKAA